MGFSFTIGELGNTSDANDIPDVAMVKRDDAPAFGEPTDFTNQRWPSYGGWHDFIKESGLTNLFGRDNLDGLLHSHPGCAPIKPAHLVEIEKAIKKRRATNGGREPGFPEDIESDVELDPTLARLIWLEYWVRWALENCKLPCFHNT